MITQRRKITSRNGHTFQRCYDKAKKCDYFLVDGKRYDNYYEAVNEFRSRVSPRRYRHPYGEK